MKTKIRRWLFIIGFIVGFSGMLASTMLLSYLMVRIALQDYVVLYEPDLSILYIEIGAFIYSVAFGSWLFYKFTGRPYTVTM